MIFFHVQILSEKIKTQCQIVTAQLNKIHTKRRGKRKKNLTKAKKQKEINDATKRNKTKNSTPPPPSRCTGKFPENSRLVLIKRE